ncbi:flagellar protein FlaG [Methylobacterium pseudosasicola]|uniref:FlaG protein n=1 Tax=Methylobacterium pseudosasicola TaxID=582667 RepID=A0A1I4S8M2_9HYPH|nr:flagellar protein FlaG [Methylobacterium pseudosasicola]SFM60613.1 FlaG protein [Methylobacterium pseudosasicola]
MDIRPLNATTPGPQGLDALAASATAAVTQETTPAQEATAPLEPAVKLDIAPTSDKARYIQDPDTSSIVFQVVDPHSGDVIEQLPSETALRNRAYDTARGQHGASSGNLSRIA